MDYRKPKRGWLYKTASLLVVSGCGHHPVSRRLEAAIGSAGSHVSFVTDAAPETAATPPPCCPWTHPLGCSQNTGACAVITGPWSRVVTSCCSQAHGVAVPAAYPASLEDRTGAELQTAQCSCTREHCVRSAQPGQALCFRPLKGGHCYLHATWGD